MSQDTFSHKYSVKMGWWFQEICFDKEKIYIHTASDTQVPDLKKSSTELGKTKLFFFFRSPHSKQASSRFVI
jgi:hypothetical protein